MLIELTFSDYLFEYVEETDDYKVFYDDENNTECTEKVKKNISKEADEIIRDMVHYWDRKVKRDYGLY